MKTTKYYGALLLILVFFACNSHHIVTDKISGTDTIPVKVINLKQQVSTDSITVSGQFTTDDEIMLSFKSAGIISSMNVKEGDAVKRGQLLATINPTEVTAQLQVAQLANEKAHRDYQRTENLYKDSVATLEQLQNAKTALDQAQQQLRLAAFNSKYAEIHAPEDGYVLKKLGNVGQQVSSGTPVLQMNGTSSGSWLLRVGISDQEWAKLHINDVAHIRTTTAYSEVIDGKVIRKSEGINESTGTFTADIMLTGKKPSVIAAGMFGNATIIDTHIQKNSNGTWQIPYEALLDGDANTGYVFITNDQKTAHKVKVTVSSINKNTATITDGLAQAKALIVSGSAYLTDNSPIIIQSSAKN